MSLLNTLAQKYSVNAAKISSYALTQIEAAKKYTKASLIKALDKFPDDAVIDVGIEHTDKVDELNCPITGIFMNGPYIQIMAKSTVKRFRAKGRSEANYTVSASKIPEQKKTELNTKYNPYRKAGGWNEKVVRAIVKDAGLDPDLVTVSNDLLTIGGSDGIVDRGSDAAGIFEFCLHLKTLPEYK